MTDDRKGVGHTPGPWEARKYIVNSWDGSKYSCCDIEGDGGNRIVANLPDFMYPGGDDQCEANARLIAAAPESHAANLAMVAALNDAFNIKPGSDDERIYDELPSSAVANAYFQARAAIARATGADT